MDGASVAVIAVIVVTFAIVLFTKYNAVIVLALGVSVAYLFSFVLTNGDMFIVWTELGYSTAEVGTVSNALTIITSSFLHKNVWHLFSNILFLLLIGLSMKKRVSNLKFLLIVLVGDILGTTVYGLTTETPHILIGSSSIIATIIGAMFAMFPRLNVVLPKPIGDTGIEFWELALIWMGLQVLMITGLIEDNDVAYSAHIAGFVVGVIVGMVSRSEVKWEISKPPEYDIDLTLLEPYCVSEEQKRMYEKAICTADPVLRSAWIRNIVKCISCPKCGRKLKVVGENFVCSNGHIIKKNS
jgi:membrane associated rhomboid family serine protease